MKIKKPTVLPPDTKITACPPKKAKGIIADGKRFFGIGKQGGKRNKGGTTTPISLIRKG